MNDEKTCLLCDYYNDGACACPSINKWYACGLKEVNPEDFLENGGDDDSDR